MQQSGPAAGLRRPPTFITRRDLRLGSGLVLFTYVLLHLVCHSF